MEKDKQQLLLSAVKPAVAKYGTAGASTRVIAEIAGVSDSHIYRFFSSRENLIAEAYKKESCAFLENMVRSIVALKKKEILPLREFAQKVFHLIWIQIQMNLDACLFFNYYYNSPLFVNSKDYYEKQVGHVVDQMASLFSDRESGALCVHSLFSFFSDYGKQMADGRLPNNESTEQTLFEIFYLTLASALNPASKE